MESVALEEAKSGGLKVDFGFSPYSERINGLIGGGAGDGEESVELSHGGDSVASCVFCGADDDSGDESDRILHI
ncbi:hypothetical protein Dsin_017673 [Dipteronia sinensis]|uniref:Uncharacterized protein n=1 Tax=Dipteronia sinensis TaxID=43782 RepID=A0AAE0AGP2_9ROSI|nr:hypothetical protein Dsin_017673 [Dipteronia sinensis]